MVCPNLPSISHVDIASVVGAAAGSSTAAITLGMANDAPDVL